MSIKEKDLIRELSIFYTDHKEGSTYTRIIKFLEESGLKIERPDLLKQIEDCSLDTYYTFNYKDENDIPFPDDESETEIYLAEEVDEKINLYDELIEKMKNCSNCDHYSNTCYVADKCYNYSHWKLKIE